MQTLMTFDVVTAQGKSVWTIADGAKDLKFRGALPGAFGYDHAAHTLRVLRGGGTACIDLLSLALPTSWMVNAKATSVTFQTWLSLPYRDAWAELLERLPADGVYAWADVDAPARAALDRTLACLAEPKGSSLAAITKVLALLRPELVPLMDDAALWFALGSDVLPEPVTAEDPRAAVNLFVPMLDWFANAVRLRESDLVALAASHSEHVYDAPQVLDRLLWVASWGHRHRKAT
jgi:hypothetical protein